MRMGTYGVLASEAWAGGACNASELAPRASTAPTRTARLVARARRDRHLALKVVARETEEASAIWSAPFRSLVSSDDDVVGSSRPGAAGTGPTVRCGPKWLSSPSHLWTHSRRSS